MAVSRAEELVQGLNSESGTEENLFMGGKGQSYPASMLKASLSLDQLSCPIGWVAGSGEKKAKRVTVVSRAGYDK